LVRWRYRNGEGKHLEVVVVLRQVEVLTVKLRKVMLLLLSMMVVVFMVLLVLRDVIFFGMMVMDCAIFWVTCVEHCQVLGHFDCNYWMYKLLTISSIIYCILSIVIFVEMLRTCFKVMRA
jgi:hypothetical protein